MNYAIDLHMMILSDLAEEPSYDAFLDVPGFVPADGETDILTDPNLGITTAKSGFSDLVGASIHIVRLPHLDHLIPLVGRIVTAERELILSPPPIDPFGPRAISVIFNRHDEALAARQEGAPVFSVEDGTIDDPTAFTLAWIRSVDGPTLEDEIEAETEYVEPVTVPVPPGLPVTLEASVPALNTPFYVGSPDLEPKALITAIYSGMGASEYIVYPNEDEINTAAETDSFGIEVLSVLNLPSRSWMTGLKSLFEVTVATEQDIPSISDEGIEVWAKTFGICLVQTSGYDAYPVLLKGQRRSTPLTLDPLNDTISEAELFEE